VAFTTPVNRATGYLVLASDWNNEHVGDLLHLHGDSGLISLISHVSNGPTTGNAGGGGAAGCLMHTIGTFFAVTTAAGTQVFASSTTADTQYRYSQAADGGISWGPGNAAADTFLQRSTNGPPSSGGRFLQISGSALWLNTASGVVVTQATNSAAFRTYLLASDANAAFQIFAQGAMAWGPGGASGFDLEFARAINTPSGTGTFLEMIGFPTAFGYGASNGGTASIASGGSAAINKPSGHVTSSTAIATGTTGAWTVTNTLVGAMDSIIVNVTNAVSNNCKVTVTTVGAGTFTIVFINDSGISITPQFNFAVIKGSQS
jgi:hypothetical protein